MSVTFIFIVPLIVAIACIVASARVATRVLGLASAASLLLAALTVIVIRVVGPLPQTLVSYPWITIADRELQITAVLSETTWLIALLPLVGGATTALLLALAIAPALRGFGALFAAVTAVSTVAAAGILGGASAAVPIAWSIVAGGSFIALRSSGVFSEHEAPMSIAIGGQTGALMILAVAMLTPLASSDRSIDVLRTALLFIAVALTVGVLPLWRAPDALASAPAALAGTLLAFGTPLLGTSALVSFLADSQVIAERGWRDGTAAVGIAIALLSAFGALGARGLHQTIGRQHLAHIGFIIAASATEIGREVIAPLLIVNAALSSFVMMLALVPLNRRADDDRLESITVEQAAAVPGVLFFIGAASAIGIPGTLGFWGRLWWLDEIRTVIPWLVAPALATLALLLVSSLAPVAAVIRPLAARQRRSRMALTDAAQESAAMLASPLIMLGIAPGIAWNLWLTAPLGAGVSIADLVRLPDVPGMIAAAIAAAASIAIIIIARRAPRSLPELDARIADHGIIAPRAIAGGVSTTPNLAQRPPSWWEWLRRIGEWLNRLSPFEQRYYMASLVISLLVMLLLFV